MDSGRIRLPFFWTSFTERILVRYHRETASLILDHQANTRALGALGDLLAEVTDTSMEVGVKSCSAIVGDVAAPSRATNVAKRNERQ